MRSGKERRAALSLCVALFNLRGKVQQEAASVLHHLHIETAMLIVQRASAQCDLCIGTQLCIERSDTAVAGTVRRSAHSSVTVDPGGSAAGTSHHRHHPLSSTITFSHSISRVRYRGARLLENGATCFLLLSATPNMHDFVLYQTCLLDLHQLYMNPSRVCK